MAAGTAKEEMEQDALSPVPPACGQSQDSSQVFFLAAQHLLGSETGNDGESQS